MPGWVLELLRRQGKYIQLPHHLPTSFGVLLWSHYVPQEPIPTKTPTKPTIKGRRTCLRTPFSIRQNLLIFL